jgi:FO synthase
LMNESITRAAGAAHGQEMPPAAMEELIRSIGRAPWQRTTLYKAAAPERTAAAFDAPPLSPQVETPVARRITGEPAAHAADSISAAESRTE